MTGFGHGTSELGERRATVDIRAVNHRFLDLKLRGASLSPAAEDAIGARVRAVLARGAVTVSVHVARATAASPTRIDAAAAGAALVQLNALAHSLGLHGPDLRLVLAQPGVVVAAESAPETSGADDAAAEQPAILAALDAALAQLTAMRTAEGTALAHELTAQLAELEAARRAIAEHAATVPAQLRKRLDERIKRLLADAGKTGAELDPQRLAHEVALLADRADVTEELVRLASHLDQAAQLVAATDPSGRRLDFLMQELGRELNTIGSKSAAAEISARIVGAKATLEKLREQVQNVE